MIGPVVAVLTPLFVPFLDLGMGIVGIIIGLLIVGQIMKLEVKLFRAIPWRYVGLVLVLLFGLRVL